MECRSALSTRIRLPRNGLHVFANRFHVAGLPITQVHSHSKHFAGVAKGKGGLVPKEDGDVKHAVIHGIADAIHNLATDFGIPFAISYQALSDRLALLLPLPGSDGSDGR